MHTVTLAKKNYAHTVRTYTILCVLTLLVGGGYGYQRYQELARAQTAMVTEQASLAQSQDTASTTSSQYLALKKTFDEKFTAVSDAMQYVLPLEENYTNLARVFDKFALDNSPFFVSDLKFGAARIDGQKDYAVLPVTMTITCTKDTLTKFLKFIEHSGMLEDKTRLMDVRSISLNFANSSADQGGGQVAPADTQLNVAVVLNAYFQKVVKK